MVSKNKLLMHHLWIAGPPPVEDRIRGIPQNIGYMDIMY